MRVSEFLTKTGLSRGQYKALLRRGQLPFNPPSSGRAPREYSPEQADLMKIAVSVYELAGVPLAVSCRIVREDPYLARQMIVAALESRGKSRGLLGERGPELVQLSPDRQLDLAALKFGETVALNNLSLTDDQYHDLPAPLWEICIEGELILMSDRSRGKMRCWRILGHLDPGQDNAGLHDFKSITFVAGAGTPRAGGLQSTG